MFSSFRPGVPFKWTDGTPLDFTNWMQSEPDQLAGPRCVEMYGDLGSPVGGLWRVADCNNVPRRAICNRPPGELLHFSATPLSNLSNLGLSLTHTIPPFPLL